MAKKAKTKRSKRVNYALIKPDTAAGKTMYPMMNRLIEKHHSELTNARIALAWNRAWKADVDGHVTLGKCKKASDLDRELAPYDFVIILRQEFFEDAAVSDEQRQALLDHELCHATVREDPNTGEPLIDEKGRRIYRTRKHDVEEFSEIVERHGIYKRDLERFASALRRSKQGSLPLEPPAAAKPSKPQAVSPLH